MDKKEVHIVGICVQKFEKLFFYALQTKTVRNEDDFRNAGVDVKLRKLKMKGAKENSLQFIMVLPQS
jgi:hypothetical protein